MSSSLLVKDLFKVDKDSSSSFCFSLLRKSQRMLVRSWKSCEGEVSCMGYYGSFYLGFVGGVILGGSLAR